MIDPVGEARAGYQFLAELARRLGYGDLYPPKQIPRELLEQVLRGQDLPLPMTG